MNMNPGWIYDERIAIVLGWTVFLLALALFLSCRVFIGFMRKMGWQKVIIHPAYQKFNSFHASFWWAFVVLLPVHILAAYGHVGIPQSGDPDAPTHWAILSLGFAGTLTFGATYFTCRCAGSFWNFFVSKGPGELYPSFYKLHQYIWLAFGFFVAVHASLAVHHAGFWPPL